MTSVAGAGEAGLLKLITPYLTTQGIAIAAGEDANRAVASTAIGRMARKERVSVHLGRLETVTQ